MTSSQGANPFKRPSIESMLVELGSPPAKKHCERSSQTARSITKTQVISDDYLLILFRLQSDKIIIVHRLISRNDYQTANMVLGKIREDVEQILRMEVYGKFTNLTQELLRLQMESLSFLQDRVSRVLHKPEIYSVEYMISYILCSKLKTYNSLFIVCSNLHHGF